jgi:hypothetical protein
MPSVARWIIALAALTLAVTSGIMACGDVLVGRVIPMDSSVHSVTVSPPGVVPMNIGTKVTFSASVQGGPGLTDFRVTWSSSNTRIATVDQTGIVTADSVGTTTITATSKADASISGAAVVSIGAPVPAAQIR